ncbi:MAG TPA: ABC transporter substrate-binding protein [Acidimicrobiales bacterium]
MSGLLLALLLVVAAACGGDGGDGAGGAVGDEAEVDPVEAADRSGSLTFAMSYGFNSLDPHRSPNALGDALWMRPLYDRLLGVANGPDGAELVPQLATSYEVSDDGRTITFELRDDVTFHDGARFDASVVEANIERAKGPESTVASTLENLERVEVVDPTHVVFHLAEPDPALLWSLAVGTAGMMVSPEALDRDLSSEPAGSGPFTLVSASRDADVVYERWDDYWDPDAALVQELTITTVPDVNARYNGLRTDEYDAAYLTLPQAAEAEQLQSEGYHYRRQGGPSSYGILLNTDEPPLDDVRVRRAISLAVNREEISEELLSGVNPPSNQPFNEGYVGHDDGVEVPYDPEEAQRLVDEAGATGTRLEVIQQMTPPQDSLAQVVQQALEDIGFEVELTPLSSTEARPAWRRGGHHAMVTPVVGQADPSQTLAVTYLGGDNVGTPPEELVAMADEARALPLGSAEREEAYQEISAWLAENPVHVPIAQFTTVIVSRPEVVGTDNIVSIDIANLEFRRVGVTE